MRIQTGENPAEERGSAAGTGKRICSRGRGRGRQSEGIKIVAGSGRRGDGNLQRRHGKFRRRLSRSGRGGRRSGKRDAGKRAGIAGWFKLRIRRNRRLGGGDGSDPVEDKNYQADGQNDGKEKQNKGRKFHLLLR